MGNRLAAAAVAVSMLTTVLLALVRAGRCGLLADREDVTRAAHILTADQLEAAITRLTRRARVVGVIVLGFDRPVSTLGDEVVARAAAAMHGAVRASDFLARTAEDGFVVLIPGSTAGQAAQVAGRMQDAVAASIDGIGPLSVSVGVAHGTGLDLIDVLRTADEALHRNRHRRAGRPVPV